MGARKASETPKAVSLPSIQDTLGGRRASLQRQPTDRTLKEDDIFDQPKKAKKEQPDEDTPAKGGKADPAQVAKLQREMKSLKSTLEVERKTNKMQMKAAKIEAKDMYEKMMKQRIEACQDAFAEEFETLAKQFDKVSNQLDEAKKQIADLKGTVTMQEEQISGYAGLIEGTGKDLRLGDEARDLSPKIEGVGQEEILEYMIELQDDPLSIEPRAKDIYEGADAFLNQPFNFYSFNVELTRE